jgi:hypothetical protein
MDHKVNGHSVAYVKRQATKLKKEMGIPHHLALDQAARDSGFENWKHFSNSSVAISRTFPRSANQPVSVSPLPLVAPYGTKQLAPGTLVRVKPWGNELAIVMSHDRAMVLYTHTGSACVARHEVSVCRDQSGAASFKPMRLFLPYGKWVCPDGSEVLYNRDYCPLWAKKPDGTVEALDPDTWVTIETQAESYFNDGNSPWWGDKRTMEIGMAVLKEWGVENKTPRLLSLFQVAIDTGDTEVLRPKNHQKRYPSAVS